VQQQTDNPNLIVPLGTQVVIRQDVIPIGGGSPVPKGTVGELIRTPADATHAYRVRFADGCEGTVRRQEFSLLKHVKNGPLGDSERALKEYDLYDFVIYRCVVGSQAYGLSHEDSDVDRRGIYLPPADLHWSLYGVPEQLENAVAEEVYWELQKFLVLALKANPNVLECLYSPLIETKTELAEDLLCHRDAFLSKLVYQTYNGYVLSQFKRLEQDLRATGAIKWKHAMHLIRLLLSGITVLREGFVPLSVESHRDQLLSIRRGEMDWESVNAWRLNLHQEFETAYAMTALPDSPDYQTVNDFLLRARRSMAR
jgi:predicted nucleotidyltransferase